MALLANSKMFKEELVTNPHKLFKKQRWRRHFSTIIDWL
jgi:hypothetical protein